MFYISLLTSLGHQIGLKVIVTAGEVAMMVLTVGILSHIKTYLQRRQNKTTNKA
jgi:hypothetical protein